LKLNFLYFISLVIYFFISYILNLIDSPFFQIPRWALVFLVAIPFIIFFHRSIKNGSSRSKWIKVGNFTVSILFLLYFVSWFYPFPVTCPGTFDTGSTLGSGIFAGTSVVAIGTCTGIKVSAQSLEIYPEKLDWIGNPSAKKRIATISAGQTGYFKFISMPTRVEFDGTNEVTVHFFNTTSWKVKPKLTQMSE
jgi:hypothetical protein